MIIFEEHFNGPTHTLPGHDNIEICDGWAMFWFRGQAEDGAERGQPEAHVITRVEPYLDPPRIPTNESHAQQWFTFMRPHAVGIKRQIAVTVGQELTLSALYHAWCSSLDDPFNSDQEDAYAMFARVGIDPTGSGDPRAGTVIWSDEFYQFDSFAPLAVTATAQAPEVTLYLITTAKWGVKHNDAYWGQVQVTADEDQPDPPPPPVDEGEIAVVLREIADAIEDVNETLTDILQQVLAP